MVAWAWATRVLCPTPTDTTRCRVEAGVGTKLRTKTGNRASACSFTASTGTQSIGRTRRRRSEARSASARSTSSHAGLSQHSSFRSMSCIGSCTCITLPNNDMKHICKMCSLQSNVAFLYFLTYFSCTNYVKIVYVLLWKAIIMKRPRTNDVVWRQTYRFQLRDCND